MSCTNYSKWDHIEISDDEDDTHPNIDTPSLFRWRHQARLEKDAQWKEEKTQFDKEAKSFYSKLEKAKSDLNAAEKANDSEQVKKLQSKLAELKTEESKVESKREELEKKQRLRPLNVDTISHEGKSKTIINKAKPDPPKELSEDDQIERLQNFVKANDGLIKKFAMIKKPDDSMNFLLEHPLLVCEETANRLVLWCVDLAVEEKFNLMEHVSHQCIVMQFMLELAKSLKIDPRSVIRPFFAKFKCPEPEYQAAFNDELSAFRDRVRKRAKARVEEAVAQLEEEERQKRLGPGGLDPVEVFETLPKEMQECFEAKDLVKLQEVISKMPYEEAKKHMDRCIASGMWVPSKDDDMEADGAEAAGEDVLEELGESSNTAAEPSTSKNNTYDLD